MPKPVAKLKQIRLAPATPNTLDSSRATVSYMVGTEDTESIELWESGVVYVRRNASLGRPSFFILPSGACAHELVEPPPVSKVHA
jgi:hypothetical protein